MRIFPGKTYSFFVMREFIKAFIVSIIFLLGLSFIVRSIQNLDIFKEFSFTQIIYLRILQAPFIIMRECMLASCMFASVYTMCNLTKNREILALRSCGVSVYRIISPLILVGFFIGIFSIAFEDFVVAKSLVAKDMYKDKLRGKDPRKYFKDRGSMIIFGENNIIYKIDRYSVESKMMEGVMIIQKDMESNIIMRIDAENVHWDGESWVFHEGVFRSFDRNGNISGREVFSELKTKIRDDPKYFGKETRNIMNMTLKDGYKYIKMMRKMGFNYKKLLTKYHRRIATSVTFFLIVVMGLSLGSMPFKNALVISFSMTLGMVLVFFFIIEIGSTFGGQGKIPPVIGGWLGNIVFFFITLFLLRKLRV